MLAGNATAEETAEEKGHVLAERMHGSIIHLSRESAVDSMKNCRFHILTRQLFSVFP